MSETLTETLARNPMLSTGIASGDAIPVLDVSASGTAKDAMITLSELRKVLQRSLALDVRDYGAAVDGVTDDTTAFASALTALSSAGGGTLLIPVGTLLLNGTSLAVPSNVTIQGTGAGSILKRTADTSPLFSFGAGGGISGVTFRGLRFLGNSTNSSGGENAAAIRALATAVDEILIESCQFDRFAYGVFIRYGNSRVTVRNCSGYRLSGSLFYAANGTAHKVVGCYVDGDRAGVGDAVDCKVPIWISDDGTAAGYGHLVEGNTVLNSYNEGIIVRSAYVRVIGNNVSYATDGASGSYGIAVEGTSGTTAEAGLGAGNFATILGNQVSYCDGGIRASFDPANTSSTARDVLVADNIVTDISGASQHGLSIGVAENNQPAYRALVTGNKVYRVVGAGNSRGIYTRNLSRSAVVANLVDTTTNVGLYIDTGTTGTDQAVDTSYLANTIINPGSAAIYLNARASGQIARLTIAGNSIHLDNTSRRGVQMSDLAGGYDSVVVKGNTTLASATLSGATYSLTGTNLYVSGNTSPAAAAVEFVGTYSIAPGSSLYAASSAPASAGATGTAGMITWDSSYIYVCVATNTWKRVAISTW